MGCGLDTILIQKVSSSECLPSSYDIKRILSKIDFLKEFTSITKEEMDEARKLIKPNSCVPNIRKDWERKPVLDALVKIIETRGILPEKESKWWVKAITI